MRSPRAAQGMQGHGEDEIAEGPAPPHGRRARGAAQGVRRPAHRAAPRPACWSRCMVEAYGNTMPLNQVGTVNVPEPRMITVQVWDRGLVKAVDKAIREAGLGLNPQTEGQTIRVPIPDLTEERRRELTRVAAKYAEEARVSVRNVRRDGIEVLKQAGKGQRDLAGRAPQAASSDIQHADRRPHQAHRRDAGAEGQGNPAGLMSVEPSPLPRRAAAACRDHHGRQRPLGEGPRPAAHRRPSPRRRSGAPHRRRRRPSSASPI